MLEIPNPEIITPSAKLPQPPDIELVNITKRFGSLLALDNVSTRLKPGTFHALLGENGAGKSTLVKCIMGFYTADSGEIIIDGNRELFTVPTMPINTVLAWCISILLSFPQ